VNICFLRDAIYLSSNLLLWNDCIIELNSLYLPVAKVFAINFTVISYYGWNELNGPLTECGHVTCFELSKYDRSDAMFA
jgi:hypothetical protein